MLPVNLNEYKSTRFLVFILHVDVSVSPIFVSDLVLPPKSTNIIYKRVNKFGCNWLVKSRLEWLRALRSSGYLMSHNKYFSMSQS